MFETESRMSRTKIMAFFLYGCTHFISVHCEFVKKKYHNFCSYHLFELISNSIVIFNILLSILKQKFIIYEGKLSINICISNKTANGRYKSNLGRWIVQFLYVVQMVQWFRYLPSDLDIMGSSLGMMIF